MRHLILIISIISIFSLLGDFALAQVNQDILTPLKQKIEIFVKNIYQKAQEKKHQKQEEIKKEVKQEVKQEANQWAQKLENKVKDFLAPLKIKIQEGSSIIREWLYGAKEYIIIFLKE